MPHLHIEYSKNLDELLDIGGLCDAIRAEAVSIETFPLAGVRVRAIRADHYAIADGDPKHGFIDISVRMREGRPMDVKQDAIQRIFNVAKEFLMPAMSSHSIALSAELRDINAELSPKYGTIREHIKDTA